MARLPSYKYVIQQINGVVILFEEGSEREIVRFDPADASATARAQHAIYLSELSDEDKCFAHFWAGYFHAHNGADPNIPSSADISELVDKWWQSMAFTAPELYPMRIQDLKDRLVTLVGPAPLAFPEADIVLPPQPLKAYCPTCGTTRELPENWKELMRETAEPDWDGVLRCQNGHEPKGMIIRARKT